MNKKDLAEIRKNFSAESDFLTINQVLTAYIDADKNVLCKNHRLFGTLEADEAEQIEIALKKTLSGTLGKSALEYKFPDEALSEDGIQTMLYSVLKGRFEVEELNDLLIDRIVNNIDYVSTYAVIAAHCTYSIFVKDKNEDNIGVSETQYNFIIVALCPASIADDQLVYDNQTNTIVKKHNHDHLISKEPADGFIYPVFSDNGSDVNHVLYYTKTAKKPNISVINDVLGCEFSMTYNDEKETFQKIMHEIVADELDYTVITKVNEKIQDEIMASKYESDLPEIDDVKLRDILFEVGVSDEKLQSVNRIYKEAVGDSTLKATNLVVSKTVVATPDVTVNISKTATEKVRTGIIDGRKCLIIDLEDPSIIINGLPTTLE